MTKVKVEVLKDDIQIQQKQSDHVSVKDSKGRLITIRKPPILDKFLFINILGANANNEAYVREVGIYNWVSAIDGLPAAKTTERELHALIERLGYEGHEAILEGIMQIIGADDALNEEGEKSLVKK